MKKLLRSAKGQHLVEFALVLPVLVIVLLVIVEFGYAINVKATITEAAKNSLMKVNKYYEFGGTQSEKIAGISSAIKRDVYLYLQQHNIPYAGSVDVNINTTAGSNTALVMVTCKYYPSFTLPTVLSGDVIPSEFTVHSLQVINATLLEPNIYGSSLTTADLSTFSADSAGADPRKSVLINSYVRYLFTSLDVEARARLAFLVEFGNVPNKYARLINWWGEDILPPNLLVDVSTGHLAVKSPYYNGGNWMDTTMPYVWVLASLGFNQATYVKPDSTLTTRSYKLDFKSANVNLNLGLPWCSQAACASCGSCDGDISISTIDNIPKRALMMRNSSGVYGTLDPVSSASNTLNTLYGHLYYHSTNPVRIFVPNSVMTPATLGSVDFTGYVDSSTTLLIDSYVDNDGDGIPNRWDDHPEFMDVDRNGQFDGEQVSIGVADITDPGIISIPWGSTPMGTVSIAPAFKFSGVQNSSVKTDATLKSYTPQVMQFLVYNIGGLYFSDGINMRRKMATWNADATTAATQKSRFMLGTASGTTVIPDPAQEFTQLTSSGGPFSPSRRLSQG